MHHNVPYWHIGRCAVAKRSCFFEEKGAFYLGLKEFELIGKLLVEIHRGNIGRKGQPVI
jgi:hypothetical protein